MEDTNPVPAVLIKPKAPRSDWELFKWLFREPTLLRRWSDKNTSKRWTNSVRFARVYTILITPTIILFWALMIACFVWTNMPAKYPKIFRLDERTEKDNLYYRNSESLFTENSAEAIQKIWKIQGSFHEKWLYLAKGLALGLARGLAGGLALGLALGLASGLAGGLAVGLAVGLAAGLAGSLTGGLAGGLVLGLAFGLVSGLASDLAFGLAFSLVGGLVRGLVGGLTIILIYGLIYGFAFGLAGGRVLGLSIGSGFIFGFYIGQFRLLISPFYYFPFFYKNHLLKNPYIRDEGIWLWLPWVKNQLKSDARQHPQTAFYFVNFLLRYRLLQRKLAAELEHIATAAAWRSGLRLQSEPFYERHFLEEELPNAWAKLTPSGAWREKVLQLRETLHNAEHSTEVRQKQVLYESCAQLIEDFEAINLRETFEGRDEYFATVKHWKEILPNQLREIAKEVEKANPITLNPYSKGYALSPELPGNTPLFLDRKDIKEELALKIQTSVSMPTFLILGQRRVGKTSLLNFLPQLLDPSSFEVVAIDAQGLSGEASLVNWLKHWRSRIGSKLRLAADPWEPPEDALKAWDEFAAFLDDLARARRRRLILAMDEYDEDQGFHYAIRQNPAQGMAFLSRMRAFSQQQKQIVFMFIGATNFSDLPEPKWSKYFVHAHIVRVDYLSEAASMQLVERPVPGFKLGYAEGVASRIYALTQGHPHLLHSICSDLVDYANIKMKNR